MSVSSSDTSTPGRGEQPPFPPAAAGGRVPPPSDDSGPRYTAPYPPYPYDPPAAAALSGNMASGLAYFTVIPAVFFLLLEPYRHNAVVRFHSYQSIFLFIAMAAVRSIEMMLVAMLPSAIAFGIGSLCSLVLFAGWLVATIKAFQCGKFLLPIIGRLAETTAASSSGR